MIMDMKEATRSCAFDKLFARNVPHILEEIFLHMDFDSFKSCLTVNMTWKEFLMSHSFQKKAKPIFNRWLYSAAHYGRAYDVQLLLSMGADPEKKRGRLGGSALISAASYGHQAVVKVLLEAGANPNVIDNEGVTPLFQALIRDQTDVAKLLLDVGADPNKGSFAGMPPLNYAVWMGKKVAVKMLLESGADTTKEDIYGRTPSAQGAWAAKFLQSCSQATHTHNLEFYT